MKTSYKVLIVGGYDFEGTDATSITLKSLLGFLNENQVAFLFTSSINHVCKYRHVFVSQKYFSGISNSKIVKDLSQNRSDVAGTTKSVGTTLQKCTNLIHTVGSSYRSIINYDLNNNVKDFIKEFKPDIIYSLLANVAIMDLCVKISRYNKAPIVPHFMDDWPHVMFSNSWLLYPARLMLKRYLKKTFNCSPFCLGISPKMCDEYSIEYHKVFYAFMNSCPDMYSYYSNTRENQIIRVTYIGGLHLNRISSIIMFCEMINHFDFFKAELSIYTSNNNWVKYGHLLKGYDFVKYEGFVSNDRIFDVYNESDILLHVESFDRDIKKYTRLSISTKIPEYLSSGKLIIAIGPKDIASIEYLATNKAALIINGNMDKEYLYRTLRDKNLWHPFIENARNLFLSNHKQLEQRARINGLLEAILETRN